MINQHNLIILKKYKDSHCSYYTTDMILKKFIVELVFNKISKTMDNNNYERLFVSIFINNILRCFYHVKSE